MIKLLSSGEIVKGLYIVCYEHTEMIDVFNPMTMAMEKQERINSNFFFKGIPYKVEDRAGPIVQVSTFGLNKFAPIAFFDLRYGKFMEVEESYWQNYYLKMGVNPLLLGMKRLEIKQKSKPLGNLKFDEKAADEFEESPVDEYLKKYEEDADKT